MTDQDDQKFTHRTDDDDNLLFVPIHFHRGEDDSGFHVFGLSDDLTEDLAEELSRYVDRHL